MKGGILIYRCRLCDEVDKSHHVADLLVTLAHSMYPRRTAQAAELIKIHWCEKKEQWGIADLIGGRKDPGLD
jgi:hypothetical protein